MKIKGNDKMQAIINFINKKRSVIAFEDIIENLKQILINPSYSGNFILSKKDELDLMNRCGVNEVQYKKKYLKSEITDLHRFAFFSHALIENVESGYPIKIPGIQDENDIGQINSYIAVYVTSRTIQPNLTDDDIKLIAIGFISAFKARKLSIEMIIRQFRTLTLTV